MVCPSLNTLPTSQSLLRDLRVLGMRGTILRILSRSWVSSLRREHGRERVGPSLLASFPNQSCPALLIDDYLSRIMVQHMGFLPSPSPPRKPTLHSPSKPSFFHRSALQESRVTKNGSQISAHTSPLPTASFDVLKDLLSELECQED